MKWEDFSDKEYHKVLRLYRAYMNGIVEDNAKADHRVYPLSFEEYAGRFERQGDQLVKRSGGSGR